MKETVSCFKPFYDENSKILILGTIPSTAGVNYNFYYTSDKNEFWPLMKIVFNVDFVSLVNDYRKHFNTEKESEYKEKFLNEIRKNNIALFDTVKTCTRHGSLDSDIEIQELNSKESILEILRGSKIKKIFCTSDN